MSRYTNKDVADWETRQEKRHYGEILNRPKQEGVGKPVSQFAVGRKEAKNLPSPPSNLTKAFRGVTADAIKHYEVAKQITIPQGVRATKSLGAGLLKDIKRKMMKHIPGKLKKTY